MGRKLWKIRENNCYFKLELYSHLKTNDNSTQNEESHCNQHTTGSEIKTTLYRCALHWRQPAWKQHGVSHLSCGFIAGRPAGEMDDGQRGTANSGRRVLELSSRLLPGAAPHVDAEDKHALLGRVSQLEHRHGGRGLRLKFTSSPECMCKCMHTLFVCWSLLYSAILLSWADSLHLHVILHEWIAFYSTFLIIHRSGAFAALTWLVPHETAAISMHSMHTHMHAPMLTHINTCTHSCCCCRYAFISKTVSSLVW